MRTSSIGWWNRSALPFALQRVGLTLLLAALPLVTGGAQRAELRPGARVRLQAPGVVAGTLEGVILDVRQDTMTFAPLRGSPMPIALSMVTAAEVYRGKSSRSGMKSGALLGGGIGLALGVMSASFSDKAPGASASSDAGTRVGGTVVITVFGAGLGALIGNSRGGEQWVRLTLP